MADKRKIYLQVQRTEDEGHSHRMRKSLEILEKFRGQQDWRTESLKEDKKQLTPV
jgi:hypothetical protein